MRLGVPVAVLAVAGTVGVLAPGAAAAATTRYEAETSPAVCTGTIDSDWPGYTGTGFCNSTNAIGAHAQFTVTATAGTSTVQVRFANGTTSTRPADLVVNGTTVASVPFESTGTWDTWATRTFTVATTAGTNTIRLNPTTSAGLPNLDALDLTTGDDTPPPTADTLYVAPGGTDGATGTISDPTTLTSALTRVDAGGTIYLRGGTYRHTQTITIAQNNSGTSSARKTITAYQNETPVLNFSAQSEDTANRGLVIGGSYWTIHGIVVERAGDNGILLAGSNNIIRRTVTRFNRDTGLQLSRLASNTPQSQWPANNLIESSVSHDNADSDGEDADGFAPKLTVGGGNVFRYTVSHNNIDDGYDLYTKSDTGPIGAVTIEDSLALDNGTLSDGSQAGNGDRNGYKLGGEDIGVNHVIRRSIAHGNGKHGFTYNRNLGTMTVSDNVSVGNEERNFNFDGGSSVFRGNTSCDSGSNDRIIGNSDSSNQFWSGSNGSRCSAYTGSLRWSFASDGRLVVTFG
ncbi:silent information regulator protein Sir2 [Actinophytocola xinjiangensis]|uniref:Silent information regulator protein Sir2 n=1 Tax=Actinophytocola xinjiangensis TaxID=485602 RepID=A0A7Z0WQM1_9PSEU|nr:carbohydrate-binding protein [Actinophytocola xinjiangensis]OLF10681.1 silent information regulator protein Sir2 [Actinophytocola xinjiangensis]